MANDRLHGGGPKDGGDDGIAESELTASEMLLALARLDAEAAQAYLAAAESMTVPEVRQKLQEFARDHERHVRDLRRCVERLAEAELPPAREAEASLLPALVRMAAPLGLEAVVMALLNDEQLTNVSYEDALAYEWDEESEGLIERHRADEQRHFEWLAEKHQELGEAGEPPKASA
jgi:rubrerythrin